MLCYFKLHLLLIISAPSPPQLAEIHRAGSTAKPHPLLAGEKGQRPGRFTQVEAGRALTAGPGAGPGGAGCVPRPRRALKIFPLYLFFFLSRFTMLTAMFLAGLILITVHSQETEETITYTVRFNRVRGNYCFAGILF